jgi:uncharacterized protein (DUF58 family)
MSRVKYKPMLKNIYLTRRFFILFGAVILIFVAAFSLDWLFPIAQTALIVGIGVVLADILILFNKNTKVEATRKLPKMMSLGDENKVLLDIVNYSNQRLNLTLIDEIPYQFQKRDFEMALILRGGEARQTEYFLRPTERGEYTFGNINLFIRSFLGLIERRFRSGLDMSVPVYPSVLQMKQFELKAIQQIAHQSGIKKIRRFGHSYEFEQIKNYVVGDDFRSLNWKASSRKAQLMVNQYEDEKSQQAYCIIDKSRSMRMPFEGLTLMDYAINTSLVLSNIILHKKDRAGLFSFSDKLGSTIQADNVPNQLNRILHELYREKEGKGEASYELLYYAIRKFIKNRSLLVLFTNFESLYALERVLPTLRLLNKFHLLVVVFFVNTEVEDFITKNATTTEDIYHQTIARKASNEKIQMMQILRQHGIQTILTRPKDLSINTINKYLELKSRGLI